MECPGSSLHTERPTWEFVQPVPVHVSNWEFALHSSISDAGMISN